MPIKRYDHAEQAHKAKQLEGIKAVPLYIMQVTDERGKPYVLLAVDIGDGDLRTFPVDTWERMEAPASFLVPQIKKALAEQRVKIVGGDKGELRYETGEVTPPVQTKKAAGAKLVQDMGNSEV